MGPGARQRIWLSGGPVCAGDEVGASITLQLLLEAAGSRAIRLETFRCSSCKLSAIYEVRESLGEDLCENRRWLWLLHCLFQQETKAEINQFSAVLICAQRSECKALLWIPRAVDFVHGYSIKSYFSSVEKYLDLLGKELFSIICILSNKSALINADNTMSIVVGTQK